jgi:hypothetical protein
MGRWSPVVAAAAAATVLACAAGLAADRLLAPQQQKVQLKTVPSSTLAQMGISLAPAIQPPYCPLGWVRTGVGGCPISRQDAEKAATSFPSTRATESVLAYVTLTHQPREIRDRLAWVVVRQGALVMPAIACVRAPPEGGNAPCRRPAMTTQIVVVDAASGQVVTVLVAGAVRGAIVPGQMQTVHGEPIPLLPRRTSP